MQGMMMTRTIDVRHLQAGTLKLEVHPNSQAAGGAAARAVRESLLLLKQSTPRIGVIFATGASQLSTLHALTSTPDLPWDRVCGFHLDEYVGLPSDHPASFRRYLRTNLTSLIPMREFYEIDGDHAELDLICQNYAEKIRSGSPLLCLLGIGENGHLAFNDPGEADFQDPKEVKTVKLDRVCRQQQLAEGWFQSFEEVPERAITLTIPTILRVPKLIVSVPGTRKAKIVRQMLAEPISTACPATILRTHPDATVYLDHESAAELTSMFAT
jgi:glucosamine-6-phosphate deaminase